MRKVFTRFAILSSIAAFTCELFPAEVGTDSQRMADALKAGPTFITAHATIVEWPRRKGDGYRVLRAGDNGWTCVPTFPGLPHDEPMCLDAVFLQFFQDAVAGRPAHIEHTGISYMYAGGWVPNAPSARPQTSDYHVGPHIMILIPNGVGLASFTKDPRSGGVYINRVPGNDTPYLVIPIHEWPKQ